MFDLEESVTENSDITDPIIESNSSLPIISKDTLDAVEKIEQALPQVKGLEASDVEMDELAGLAKESFNNLMDLGMQVDARFSAEIFSVASNMLGHALTAKTAKINKKLKMIDLQLKKADLDRKLAQTPKDKSDETPLGNGTILDRNELLKIITKQTQDNENGKKDK